MIEKASFEQAIEIYKIYMEKDFPQNEIPNFERFKKLTENKKQDVYIYKEGNKIVAYFVTMEKEGCVLITHLAVVEEFRSKGIGRRFLEEIKDFLSNRKILIVEVETEKNAKDENELEIINKRIRYYIKADFKKCERMEYELFGVDYYILTYSTQNVNIEENKLKEIMEKIYDGLFPRENLRIEVK